MEILYLFWGHAWRCPPCSPSSPTPGTCTSIKKRMYRGKSRVHSNEYSFGPVDPWCKVTKKVNNCFASIEKKSTMPVWLCKSADILILLLTNILFSIYNLIPLCRYKFADLYILACFARAKYSSLKKRKSRLAAVNESGELLPVCGQLMTYLMKK